MKTNIEVKDFLMLMKIVSNKRKSLDFNNFIRLSAKLQRALERERQLDEKKV